MKEPCDRLAGGLEGSTVHRIQHGLLCAQRIQGRVILARGVNGGIVPQIKIFSLNRDQFAAFRLLETGLLRDHLRLLQVQIPQEEISFADLDFKLMNALLKLDA